MNKFRKTVVTIETHQILVVRRTAQMQTPLCAACADEVGMLTPLEAAHLVGVSQRTVYHWVEDERIHFAETADGDLFVCLAPLLI
jgi:excisionase family DNA binding protein